MKYRSEIDFARLEPRVTILGPTLLAAWIGAACGLISWIDQLIMGVDYQMAVSDMLPVVGFTWNVFGGAIVLATMTAAFQALRRLGQIRRERRA